MTRAEFGDEAIRGGEGVLKLGIGRALILLAIGGGLVIAGVAMVYMPAAFVLAGGGIVAGTLWGVEI
jgi:hypothetical protein